MSFLFICWVFTPLKTQWLLSVLWYALTFQIWFEHLYPFSHLVRIFPACPAFCSEALYSILISYDLIAFHTQKRPLWLPDYIFIFITKKSSIKYILKKNTWSKKSYKLDLLSGASWSKKFPYPSSPKHTHIILKVIFEGSDVTRLVGDKTELDTGEDKPIERADQKCLIKKFQVYHCKKIAESKPIIPQLFPQSFSVMCLIWRYEYLGTLSWHEGQFCFLLRWVIYE